MDFIKSPKAIEDKSMDLINPFIMDIDLTPEEVTVYSRMIHASGDVDYGHLIQTSKGVVVAGIEALAKGRNIYTDVNMVKAGINKNALHALGSEVFCRVSDPEIAAIAKERHRPLHGDDELLWHRPQWLDHRRRKRSDRSL